jgi:hypothetical protein
VSAKPTDEGGGGRRPKKKFDHEPHEKHERVREVREVRGFKLTFSSTFLLYRRAMRRTAARVSDVDSADE